ncbi:hypothetical protein TRAPUB_8110 [Trametes pubescens]|uniref:Uncharacterized protein n=1 Tax=Trametes pubescens TaxID=154538 RepID=A0A1M2W615_TRAPU|nr:hypothetical protein TRAPUB_8110 [Trametes pubescens]
MGALTDLERCNQDAANLATVSGISGLNFVDFVARQLPGPTIDRGYTNLRYVSEKLKEEELPVELEKGYYAQHDK